MKKRQICKYLSTVKQANMQMNVCPTLPKQAAQVFPLKKNWYLPNLVLVSGSPTMMTTFRIRNLILFLTSALEK